MKLVLLIFLFPLVCFGQTTYRGTVKDKKNNKAISFATVGLIQENIGTTSDEHGNFELKSFKKNTKDSLIVNCLGYKVFKIKVSDMDTLKVEILLTEKSFNLKEIVVTNKKRLKSEFLNDFKECSGNFEATSVEYPQLAQHFQVQNINCQLTKVKICEPSAVRGKISRYRLRIYGMDPITKGPSNDLCSKVIEVRTKLKRSGVYTINLEKYNIIIPNTDFFIAVEWLKIPSNYDEKMFGNQGGYSPWLGWTPRTDLTLESWQLSYGNRWIIRPQNTLLISATIKN